MSFKNHSRKDVYPNTKPSRTSLEFFKFCSRLGLVLVFCRILQKGGVPAAPSGTATLLRLSPNYQFRPRPLLNGYGLQAPPAFMA